MKGKWFLTVLIAIAAIFFSVSLILFLRAGRSPLTPAGNGAGDQAESRGDVRLFRATLYYYRESDSDLVGFPREVELPGNAAGGYRRFLEILLAGQPGVIVPVPEPVKVRCVFYLPETKMAVVDFSETFDGALFGGSQEELEFIAFFVTNLCRNFPEIQKVKFLSGGVDVRAPGGHLDWERTYTFDPAWISRP